MYRYPVSKPCIGDLERYFVNQALDRVQLSQGPMVKAFERALAGYLGVKHALAVTSGTTALHLALAAYGIGPGDEVLVPDLTFVATANAVTYTGATPVLVDVDPRTWCMDVADALRKTGPRTRLAVPVHLYGVACDVSALRQHGLDIVEDAAEGLGGSLAGTMLGALESSVMGTFSFYGNKVVTCGEGGAVVTNDDDLAARLFFLRGQALDPKRRYYHPEVGFNYRMTDLQAAVGCGQLGHLPTMLARRRRVVTIYRSRLCRYDVGIAQVAPLSSRIAPWVFSLQLNASVDRGLLAQRLDARGIETRPGFVPLHRLPMYARSDQEFPVTSALADRIISLPTYPDLTDADAHAICDAVLECAR